MKTFQDPTMMRNPIPVDAFELEEAVEFVSSFQFFGVEEYVRVADCRVLVAQRQRTATRSATDGPGLSA